MKLASLYIIAFNIWDTWKDNKYIFYLPHEWDMLLLLIFSNVVPAVVTHVKHSGNYTFSMWHSICVSLSIPGFNGRFDKLARNPMTVALIENLPQFLVQMVELSRNKNSVNFYQAGLPIISYCVILINLSHAPAYRLFGALIMRE